MLVSGQQSADPFLSEGHYLHTALTSKSDETPGGRSALPDVDIDVAIRLVKRLDELDDVGRLTAAFVPQR